jgi:hypothetical protein
MDKNKIKNYNYVIYKGTGGLIHMLCGLAYCLDWCQKNSHILIIDVISHQCYNHYISDFFIIKDVKCIYNETYDMDLTLKFHRISVNDIKNYPNIEVDRGLGNNTHKYMLDRFNIRVGLDTYEKTSRIKIYAGPGSCKPINLLKYFKVKPEILKIITDHPPINNYIGVHFRNTDIKNDINNYIDKINILCNNTNINTIYLATDDYESVEIFKNALPNKTFIMYVEPFKSNGKPIHYANDNKYNLIINLLTDIYYLEKSTHFIDSPLSLVSKLVKAMKENNNSIF